MGSILSRSSLRYLIQHPWQAILSILGIAVGVAVVVAIDLANQSAENAFKLSMDSVAGEATHQISASSSGIPDSLYRFLRVEHGIRDSAPVVESYVAIPDHPGRTLLLLGLDVFAERPFRSYLQDLNLEGNGGLGAFLTRKNAALISHETGLALGISSGDTLAIRIGAKHRSLEIIGLLEPKDSFSKRSLENLILCDIAAAQEMLGMGSKISRIDLIIPDTGEGESLLQQIKSALPDGIILDRSGSRSQILEQMTRAFSINLTALSLLALIVGMFLIYNTMTFSVVQRRSLIGLMRAIGITRREIFALILSEALLLGFIGSAIGLLLGILIGQGLVQLVTRSINDLYFVVNVQSLDISLLSLLKGFLLGVCASLLAALKPSREATATSARDTLSRSVMETKLQERIPRLTFYGFLGVLLGTALLMIPTRNLTISYAGILFLIIGFMLWTPLSIIYAMKLLQGLMSKIFGMPGKLSARDVAGQLSRTSIAIAALSMAVAATVGVGIMVGSFRATVLSWLENRLTSDVYISAPTLVSRRNDATMDPAFIERIAALPEISDLNMYREITIETQGRLMYVMGSRLLPDVFYKFQFKDGDARKIWERLKSPDAVIISEPYAYKYNTAEGDIIEIPTDNGNREFQVAGVFYDYVSDVGVIMMHLDTYQQFWDDRRISGASAVASPGYAIDSVIDAIRNVVAPGEEILIRSNREIREVSITIFDRTFMITNVLRLLAIGVAFIGVLSALMAMQLERARDLGILRANGLTPGELWKLVTLQTGLMGFISGILALPMGGMLAYVLIFIINRRSFGWTLQFQFMPEIYFQAIILAVVAAILAGLYPSFKMSKASPALALREE